MGRMGCDEFHFPLNKTWLNIWLVHENELYLQFKM